MLMCVSCCCFRARLREEDSEDESDENDGESDFEAASSSEESSDDDDDDSDESEDESEADSEEEVRRCKRAAVVKRHLLWCVCVNAHFEGGEVAVIRRCQGARLFFLYVT